MSTQHLAAYHVSLVAVGVCVSEDRGCCYWCNNWAEDCHCCASSWSLRQLLYSIAGSQQCRRYEKYTYSFHDGKDAGAVLNAAKLPSPSDRLPVSWLLLTSNTAPTRVSGCSAAANASRLPLKLLLPKFMYARLGCFASAAGITPAQGTRHWILYCSFTTTPGLKHQDSQYAPMQHGGHKVSTYRAS